ncbi:uncharacterized protein MYCFIDRAFT_37517 [Pseudocercospora fijiensis CIRAD86]|uniref:Major facilitator superfamily (MFS) profile domain-containing protein n=1 Tax=Pseudocercospora fijiensis (strain CIRAD86) TaxID=383855 RepID=M2ZL62_PSEFD|nr:uncharacterized protein MYCFIDRAFT_37517 [Pseudocercospora fijiensis CIRAD86]EME79799.1 hypothetical protein MYCFIDRAFT_37517 [Pseudocercospora fijiensis CIRAD86]
MSSSSNYPKFLGMNGKPLEWTVTVILTFGFVLVGYDQGVMSGVITAPQWLSLFPRVNHNATLLGFTVAIYDIGTMLGAVSMIFLGDRLGRKKSCLLGGAGVIIGVVIQVTAMPSSSIDGRFAQFLIGRTITGWGNGINMASMAVWQSELSHASRGMLVCLLNYGIQNYTTSITWRFPIAFQIVLCLVYFIGTSFLPESPRWLCKMDRIEAATKSMAAINKEPIDGPKTKEDIRGILDSIAIEQSSDAGFFGIGDMFTGGPSQHWRRVLIGVSSQFFQQITGCNAVIYYSPILFLTTLKTLPHFSQLIGGVDMIVYALFALLSFWTVESVGRRKVFLIGTAGQMVSMIITFACIIPGTASAAKGAAFGLFLYIAFFGPSYLTVPWLYAAEINPIKIRAKGAAAANIVNWSFNFLVVMVTPIMIQNIGWGTYLFFAAVNAAALPFIYFFYPETSHRSLEEIDFIFAKGYYENISYVKAAKEMPRLTNDDMEALADEYGLTDVKMKRADSGKDSAAEVETYEKV